MPLLLSSATWSRRAYAGMPAFDGLRGAGRYTDSQTAGLTVLSQGDAHPMQAPDYAFLRHAGRILNSGQARTLVFTGAIEDLYFLKPDTGGLGDEDGEYVPLLTYLTTQWDVSDRILVVYELNGPIRFLHEADKDKVKDAWLKLRTGLDANQIAVRNMLESGRVHAELSAMSTAFDTHLDSAIGKPTLALELLRQMCLASRTEIGGQRPLAESLIVFVEAADLVIPEAEITRLSDADRHRIAICQDWFSDPGFNAGSDAVILLAESRSVLNHRIAQMPQVLEVRVDTADQPARHHFIDWFDQRQPAERRVKYEGSHEDLAQLTAGLSIHALSQLLKGGCYAGQTLTSGHVVGKVEEYIKSQLGEDIIEFKKPAHTLDDVVGFTQLKSFLRDELIPRFRSSGPDALPGAAVAGPIGGGQDVHLRSAGRRAGRGGSGAQEHPQPVVRPDRRDLRASAPRAQRAFQGVDIRRRGRHAVRACRCRGPRNRTPSDR